MKQETVNPELFRWNRKRFAREMREDSIAVFCSNDLIGSNGEIHCRFRQNPDLYYLSGITQPETMLVLAPNTAKQGFDEVLFIRRADHRLMRQFGPGLTIQQAAQLSGIQQVCFLDELDGVLHELVLLASRVYINSREDSRAYSEAPAPDTRFAERLMKLYPAHKYHRAQPILKQIGMVKSAPEVGLISRSLELAKSGFQAAAGKVRNGVAEHEVEAAAVQRVIAGGAQGFSHPTSVASGRSSLYPAYEQNSGVLAEGEILQLQLGVVYAGYHASIARVLPVGGQFSKRQLEVYTQLTSVLKTGISLLVPGATLPECEEMVRDQLSAVCEQLGIPNPMLGEQIPQHCFHHMGRNARDPFLPYAPLQSGMVIACEPALYLPSQGFGMLLRNMILVTDEGPVDLSADIALNADELEAAIGLVVR